MEEGGSRIRVVRQAVVDLLAIVIGIGRGAEITVAHPVGLGVFGHVLAIIVRVPVQIVPAVGMEQVITVVRGVGVHTVAAPHIPVVVDMEDEQALSRDTVVPFGMATVFEDIELVVVAGVAEDIGLPSLTHGLHTLEGCAIGEFDRITPAHVHLLHGREIRRTPAFVGVVAAIHQVPLVDHREIETAGRIDVGQAQAVGKLMADGADATKGSVAP